jgi:hypothetical protein
MRSGALIRQWAVMHPCGLAIIMATHAQPSSDRFDERSIGLDHLALRGPDRAALEAWVKRFDELDVEHSGIKDENGGPLLTFRDPDNIQLEFHAFDPNQATTNIDNEITLAEAPLPGLGTSRVLGSRFVNALSGGVAVAAAAEYLGHSPAMPLEPPRASMPADHDSDLRSID